MPTPPRFSPTVALLTVSRTWEAELAGALEPLGLTTRRYALLGHVGASPGISFSELARRSRITVQSAHAAAAAFVRDGLVDDGTAQAGAAARLQVTAEGRALLTRAAAAVDTVDAELAARHPGLTSALRQVVDELLR